MAHRSESAEGIDIVSLTIVLLTDTLEFQSRQGGIFEIQVDSDFGRPHRMFNDLAGLRVFEASHKLINWNHVLH